MKKFIKFLFLIFFIFNTFVIANAYTNSAILENTNTKVEYFSSKQNQTFLEISKKQDLFIAKNEENSQITSINTSNKNSSNNNDVFGFEFVFNNDFYFISSSSFYRIKHSISPLFAYSIATRAP